MSDGLFGSGVSDGPHGFGPDRLESDGFGLSRFGRVQRDFQAGEGEVNENFPTKWNLSNQAPIT